MIQEETGLLLRREWAIRRLIGCGKAMAALRRAPRGWIPRLFWRIFCKRRREKAYHELAAEVAALRKELLAVELALQKENGRGG